MTKPFRIARAVVQRMYEKDSSRDGIKQIANHYGASVPVIRRILESMGLLARVRRPNRVDVPLRPRAFVMVVSTLPEPSPAMLRLAQFDPIVARALAQRRG